jgi:plasmid stabilization system protein ParE
VTYRIEIQPRAQADTAESFRWLYERAPAAAVRWRDGLLKAIDVLKKNPERHPVSGEESERFGMAIRQMLYGRRCGIYRVLFTVEGETISVLAIRRSARGPIEP